MVKIIKLIKKIIGINHEYVDFKFENEIFINIKVGEIFFYGTEIIEIYYKISENKVVRVADNWTTTHEVFERFGYIMGFNRFVRVKRMSKEGQNLFIGNL